MNTNVARTLTLGGPRPPAPRRRPAGAPSLSRFLRRRLAARAAALAVPALLALAAPAAAQAATLVSNLGQSTGAGHDLASNDAAQAFATGSVGATLSAVTVNFGTTPSGVTVELRTGVSVSSAGTTEATLSNPSSFATGNNTFTAPAGTGLTANTTYWVVIEGTSGTVNRTNSGNEDSGVTGWSVGNSHRTRAATSSAGFNSEALRIVKLRVEGTLFTAPPAPAAPSVTTGSATSLKVAWRAPASDGGDAITDYDVRWRERFATTWTEMDDTSASTATRTTVTGLAAGNTYDVQVRAQNAVGDGAWSPSTQGQTYAALSGGTMTPNTQPCPLTACMDVPASSWVVPGPGAGEFTVHWVWSKGSKADVSTWQLSVYNHVPIELTGNEVIGIGKAARSFTLPGPGKPALLPNRIYKIELWGRSAVDNGLQSMAFTPNFISPPRRAVAPIARVIKQVGLVSSPTHDSDTPPDGVPDTFVRDDRIVIDVTFAEAMRVDTKGADANVALRVDVGGLKKFPLERVLYGGQVLRFVHTVAAGDTDTDGFSLSPDTASGSERIVVDLLGGATVTVAATGVAADLRLSPGLSLVQGNQPRAVDKARLKVAGSRTSTTVPRVTGANIVATSSTATQSSTLTVTFDKALTPIGGVASIDRQQSFDIRATNLHLRSTQRQHPTGVSLSADGRTLTLTLGTPVRAADRVELSYGPVRKWSNPRERIQVLKGANGPVPRFGGLHVTNNLTGAPPIPLHANIARTELTIVFDKALNETARPAGSAFRVDARGWDGRPGRSLRGTGTAAVSGDTVLVTLGGAVDPAETADVHYRPPASNALTGAGTGGGKVNAMESFEVTAVHDVTPPKLLTSLANIFLSKQNDSAGLGKSKIHLYFDEALDRTSVPAPGAFALSSSDTNAPAGAAVASVEIEQNVVSLTTSHWLGDNIEYTLVYLPGDDPIRDLAGNAVNGFSKTISSFATGRAVPRTQEGKVPKTTLVSNLRQADAGSTASLSAVERFAQKFTAGSGGASLGAVVVDFGTYPSGVTVKVGTGNGWSLTNPVTLNNPSGLAPGRYRFAAPAGTTLTAGNFWVVIQGSGGTVRRTDTNNEDAGKVAGWSIDNEHCSLVGDSWSCSPSHELKIRVERPPVALGNAGFTVDGRKVKINMRQPLDPGSVPAPSAFARWETEILQGETTYRELVHNRIESVTVNGSTATLHLEHPILPCAGQEPFRVSYTVPDANPLQTTDGWDAPAWGADHGVNPVRNELADRCVRIR